MNSEKKLIKKSGQSGLVYVWDCVTGHLLHKFQAHHKSTSKILATRYILDFIMKN